MIAFGAIAAGAIADSPAAAAGAYTLTADAASFMLSGQSVGLLAARIITGATASFTLGGQSAGLLAGKRLTAATGSLTLNGQAATLLATRTLAGGAASFTLGGQPAGLTAARVITGGAGSFTLTGKDATLTYTPNSGAYTLSAAAGSFTLGGQDATLTYVPNAPPASETTGGWVSPPITPPHLLRHLRLAAAPGRFMVRGASAALLTGVTPQEIARRRRVRLATAALLADAL